MNLENLRGEVNFMEKCNEGGQSKVYRIDDNFVFKHYKQDGKYPIDFKTIEIMCEELQALNRIIVPIKIDYDKNNKIVGTYYKYIKSQPIELSNVQCSKFYQWYIELLEDVKKVSSKKIRMKDLVDWNFIINTDGPFFIDVESFILCNEETSEKIEQDNISDLNYTFLYGFVWKVGQFVTKQSFEEIFSEIRDFSGTLFEYVQYKNPYDYGMPSCSR